MARLLPVVVIALAACGGSPTALDDAEPMEPFPWFAGAYADMEECSGVDGDFARVVWYGVLNAVQVGDSLPYARNPQFRVEWGYPHRVYVGYTTIDGVQSTLPIDVLEGSLRDLLQTNELPHAVRDDCGVPVLS